MAIYIASNGRFRVWAGRGKKRKYLGTRKTQIEAEALEASACTPTTAAPLQISEAEDEINRTAELKLRAKADYDYLDRHVNATHKLDFPQKRIALVFLADVHIGAAGSDVWRAFAEARKVVEIPDTWIVTIGDLADNMILGALQSGTWDNSLSLSDQWLLVKDYFKIIYPRWLVAVGGNNEYWLKKLTGVDWTREQVLSVSPDLIYDPDDCKLELSVGGHRFPGRVRHKWRGSSQYSDTHGIEKAAKWDGDFVWGVGAHLHKSGVARQFNVGGHPGMAVLCGAYKRIDEFARRLGFPVPNPDTAMAIIFSSDGKMTGTGDLDLLQKVMT